MTREVAENADGQGKWTDTTRGPRYWDAFALAREVALQYDVHVHFRLHSLSANGPWTSTLCRIDACALVVRGPEKSSVVGSANFGGNSGARTMPGAMVAALYTLEDKLTDTGTAWIPAMYPHS